MESKTQFVLPRLNKWHVRRMFGSLKRLGYSLAGEAVDWKKILRDSGLGVEGYSADQLQKIFLYLSEEHNIGNLEQFDDHARADVCVWEKDVSGCSLCKNIVSGSAIQIGEGSLGDTEHGREMFTKELNRLKEKYGGGMDITTLLICYGEESYRPVTTTSTIETSKEGDSESEPLWKKPVIWEETTTWKGPIEFAEREKMTLPLSKPLSYQFKDADWKEALAGCWRPLREMTDENWRNRFMTMRIGFDRTGSDIRREFISQIVPRLRQLGCEKDLSLEPYTPLGAINRHAMMAIFHCITEPGPTAVKRVINSMISDKLLAVPASSDNPVELWYRLFVGVLLNHKLATRMYFNTTLYYLDWIRNGTDDKGECLTVFKNENERVEMAWKPYRLANYGIVEGSRAARVNWEQVFNSVKVKGSFAELTEENWMMIIQELKLEDYNEVGAWRSLQQDFFSFAVPRCREFGYTDELNLKPWIDNNPDQTNLLTQLVIFHSMKEATPLGVKIVINKMLSDKLLTEDVDGGQEGVEDFWFQKFWYRFFGGVSFNWNAPANIIEQFKDSYRKSSGVFAP